jgi:hypothetical protein
MLSGRNGFSSGLATTGSRTQGTRQQRGQNPKRRWFGNCAAPYFAMYACVTTIGYSPLRDFGT